MSINDLLDVDLTSPIFLVFLAGMFIVIIMSAVVGLSNARETNKKIFGTGEGKMEEKSAIVISKSTIPNPLNPQVSIAMVVFEFEDGERKEFALKAFTDFNMIKEGDKGTLFYRGNSFVKFNRNI